MYLNNNSFFPPISRLLSITYISSVYVCTYVHKYTYTCKKDEEKEKKNIQSQEKEGTTCVFQACINKFQGERMTRTGLFFFGLLLLFFSFFLLLLVYLGKPWGWRMMHV